MSLLASLRFITAHPVNRDNKLRALARFFRWQLSSRLAMGETVYEWVDGARFLVRSGETGLTGNVYAGLHEFADMGYLLHVLRADDLFLDIGANVGSYTLLACAARGARGHAFEPIPSTFGRLVQNVRLNHLEARVQCHNLGLGEQEGTLLFTGNMDTVNHVVPAGEQQESALEVPVKRLDDLVNLDAPTLMKIDVEGFETSVLAGALRTLADPKLHSVIMELNGSGGRYGFDETKILALMGRLGFETFS